jgi:hypothetical protein
MKKGYLFPLLALAIAGCASTPPQVEVQVKKINMKDVEDASGCYIAGRFVDTTYTPFGFLTGSRFSIGIRNLDTDELFWMGFRTNKEIAYYPVKPGRYVVTQVVKENAQYVGNGKERKKIIVKIPYLLPDILLSEFQIAEGEVLYMGTLTTKDEPYKSSIVYENDFEVTEKAILKAAYIMTDFIVKPYLESEQPG